VHSAGKLPGAASDGAKQWPLRIVAELGAVEISREVFLEIVMARHRVALAALLPQPHPKPAVLRVDILDGMPSAAPMRAKE
jgi:hypothetical protein